MKNTLTSLLLQLRFAIKSANKTIRTKSSNGLALLLLITVLFSAGTGYAQCTSFVTVGSVGFSGTNAHDHSLAVDPAGVPYVAFQDGNNGNKASVMKYNGSTWVAVGSSGISIGATYSVKLVIDKHSSIPYIWYYDTGNGNQLMVMKYESGSWMSVGTTGLTSDNSEVNWTSMAIDPTGNPYISYMDYTSDYKISVKKYNGSSWVSVGSPGMSSGSSIQPSIAINSSGVPYVLYSEDNGVKVQKFNGTDWVYVDSASLYGKYGDYPEITFDNTDKPIIIFTGTNLGGTAVMKYDGISWSFLGSPGLIYWTAEIFGSPSMIIDPAGVPYVVCIDPSNLTDYRASVIRYNGTDWDFAGNPDFSAAIAEYTTIASNASGDIYMLYTSTGNHAVTVMKMYTIPAITGTNAICLGNSTTLSNATGGGTWISSNPASVTVGSATGIVSGISPGGATINYVPPIGCTTTFDLVVDANATAITGPGTVNTGGHIVLFDTVSGGTWSSSNTGIATVGATGLVNGIALGTATISYSVANSCGTSLSTKTITVVATPPVCNTWWQVGTAVIPDSSNGTSDALIQTDASGTPYVLFTSQGLCVSKFNGSDWESIGATDFAFPERFSESIVFDKNNTPYVAFGDGANDNYLTVMKFDGSSWVSVGSFGSMLPSGKVWETTSLAADNNGNLYLSYNDLLSRAYYILKYDGSAWQIIYTSGTYYSLINHDALLIDKLGNLNALIPDLNTNNLSVLRYINNTWEPVGPQNFSGDNTSNAILAQDPSGTRYVAFTDHSNGDKATVMKFNGSTWETVGTAGFSTGATYQLRMHIAGDGTPYVMPGYDYNSTIGTKKFDGVSWVNVANTAPYNSNAYDFAIDNQNVPYFINSEFYAIVRKLQPGIAPVTGATTACIGTSTTLSNLSSVGSWSSSNTAVATVAGWPDVDPSIALNYNSVIVTGVASGTATISYTIISDCGTLTATTIVTINPSSAGMITGPASLCTGVTTTLNNATTGGTWSSDNNSVASINPATGVISGVASSIATISYSVMGTCCLEASTIIVTVNGTPSAGTITGIAVVCIAATTTLSNAATGGVWTSGNGGVATVGSATGLVSGISVGTADVTYTVNNGCSTSTVSKVVTVNNLPSAGSIIGTTSVCVGATTTLSNTIPGGTWITGSSHVATIGSTSGILTGINAGNTGLKYFVNNGCGSANIIQTVTVTSAATAGSITGTATVCAGATTTLGNATAGGVWSSNNSSIAAVGSATGIVSGVAAGNTIVTYTVTNGCGSATATKAVTVNALPDAGTITGTATACASATTTLTNTATGGSWSSSNSSVATIGSSNGILTGVTAGNTDITYTITNSCGTATVTKAITVNAGATAGSITGTASLCAGATTTLDNATTGGVWSSNNSSIAAVGSSTGIVSGVAAGNTTITYTVTNGCGSATATKAVTVNALPDAGSITGTATLCPGATTTLSNTATGGVWSSNNTLVASVGSSTGIVTGIAGGNTIITYTMTNGCGSNAATKNVTVNTLPDAGTITGASNVGIGASITLADAAASGIWTSGATGIATVDMSGVVTGVAGGTATISYSVANLCGNATATKTITVNSGSITGSLTICAGTTSTLSCAGGGTWSSGNTAVALAGGTTGVVTG